MNPEEPSQLPLKGPRCAGLLDRAEALAIDIPDYPADYGHYERDTCPWIATIPGCAPEQDIPRTCGRALESHETQSAAVLLCCPLVGRVTRRCPLVGRVTRRVQPQVRVHRRQRWDRVRQSGRARGALRRVVCVVVRPVSAQRLGAR